MNRLQNVRSRLAIFGSFPSFIIGISGAVSAPGSAKIRPIAVVSENQTLVQFTITAPAPTAFASYGGRGLRK